jgi:crotonobetainyl-CoA:carnitine CoA-transferase CaiB-like acyl-CoA transferase
VTQLCARVLGELTLDQAITTLDAAGVACGRVNHSEELLAHPQLEARDRWRAVDSPVGPIRSLLPPPIATGWSPRMDPIPDVGDHTLQILHDLGRSDAEITALVAARVVGLPPAESDRRGDHDGRR